MGAPDTREGLLRNAADVRSIAFAAVHFTLVGTAFWFNPSGWSAALAVFILAYSAFIQLISGHNAMHAPVFTSKGLNRLWQVVLSLTFCYPVSAFVPVHNLSHHMHLQTPRDVLRTTEVRHRNNLLNLLHHVLMAGAHIHALNAVYLWRIHQKKRAWFLQARLEIIAVLLYGSTLITLSGARFFEWVFLPALIGQLMIFGFGHVQHDGTDEQSEFNHSRNFKGRLFNWLIFENAYHTIHHNQPGLHWSKSPEVHAKLIAPHIHPALDQQSVLAYMWRTYVWPGKRLRFDGEPVVLPPERASWDLLIPAGASEAGAATGAVAG
ncbi:MAG: fatty acid desaturase [Deltaproteobacteria bacterium]|nr:fatty acid desaturase [Deltaproteobacteria bacterium]